MAEKAEKQIGEVTNYFSHAGVIAIKLKAPLKVGDKIKVKGGETEFEEVVDSMQIDRNPIQAAKKGDEVGIKVSQPAHRGNKVFKA